MNKWLPHNENLIFLSDFLGSAHGPLRSSLKKPKNRDVASVSSKSSSKQVRISLGAEQTAIWNSDSIFSYSRTRKKNRQFVPIFLQNCCSDYIGSHITVIKKYKRDTTNLIDEPNMAAIPNQSLDTTTIWS